MAVIELVRKCRGGRSPGIKSDLRVYATIEKRQQHRFSIGIRVSESVMKRLRWLVGDLVRASFDDGRREWSLRRVSDNTGNRLSGQGRKDGAGTVRFAVEKDDLAVFGLDGDSGYDCCLVSCDGDVAVFRAE